MSKDTAAEIKRLRKSTGLTQEQFATLVGVSFVTINRWENGRATPHALILESVRTRAAQARRR